MRFRSALLQAFSHAIPTLAATFVAWVVWSGSILFIQGYPAGEMERLWDSLRFAMFISLTISLLLGGGFLVVSLIYHYFKGDISLRQHVLSSLTLVLSSLILWFPLPNGGAPLIALIIALPILASFWMLGGRQTEENHASAQA